MAATFWNRLADFFRPRAALPPVIEVSSLPLHSQLRSTFLDGDKFYGGFGDTKLFFTDYWTLRARSAQLFEENLYARGLIRRLVTNEINTGLSLEAQPDNSILGLGEDYLVNWTETVESRFHIYEQDAQLCDHREQLTFGALQAAIRLEALVTGDVLVVLRYDRRTGLPRVHLISGSAVQTPMVGGATQSKIVHGVELDGNGRQVAYHILQGDFSSKRLPAYGEKSGRRLAWLVYGTDKRLDEVRGKPILSLVLQSLKEVDRYRDSVQRKAVINSMLAMFIKKNDERMGTRPITGGAIRRTSETVSEGNAARTYNITEQIPGLIVEELQVGEEPHGFPSTGTDEKFGDFEEAIIQAVAWANEIPPEILRLSFSSNYSASQAAINEFKIYLNRVRQSFSDQFCRPFYVEWLISEVLNQKISAPGLLDAWRSWEQYDRFGAWTVSDWSGHIKPAVDMSKLVDGYTQLVQQGFITRRRAARELTGTKYDQNVRELRIENERLSDATRSMQPEQESPSAQEPQEERRLNVVSE